MKCLVVFAAIVITAQAIDPKLVKEFQDKVTKFGEQCMAETKASGEDVAKLMAHQLPDTHEGKCMISCVYKNFKMQNADGTMNGDETKKLIGLVKESDEDLYEKLMTVFTNCHDIGAKPDPDHCITATNVAICVNKEGTAIGLKSELFGI